MPRTQLDALSYVVNHEFEHATELSVPIEVTLEAGGNLYEIEEFDLDEIAVES